MTGVTLLGVVSPESAMEEHEADGASDAAGVGAAGAPAHRDQFTLNRVEHTFDLCNAMAAEDAPPSAAAFAPEPEPSTAGACAGAEGGWGGRRASEALTEDEVESGNGSEGQEEEEKASRICQQDSERQEEEEEASRTEIGDNCAASALPDPLLVISSANTYNS